MSNGTHPLALNDRGERVTVLQESLGNLGYPIPRQEIREQVFGVGTEDALLSFQSKSGLRRTGILDEDVEAALTRAVSIVETGRHQVEGRIFSEQGVPAVNAPVRLYGIGFGGAETRLGEAHTDDQGFYAIPYEPAGRTANLEVRVLGLDGEEVSLSTTRIKADRYEMLNLVAPADTLPLAPEYDRLSVDLDECLGEQSDLRDAEENGDRQDLTLLHRETGWDARLIALAAMADELSADTEIPRDALYALFRVGLPTDKHLLARLGGTVLRKALDKAAEAGIVGFDAERIAEVEAAFDAFARTTRRTEKAPGALSTSGDLMEKSGLAEEERGLFEDLYFAQRDNADELWERARERGISEASIEGLRLQGKLACLTLNNAELAASLQQDVGSPDDLATLVDLDLYQADTWKERLDAMARGENDEVPQDLIPPAYEGDTVDDRRDAYAADLARKVRLSFPAQVIGRMIEKGDLSLGNGHDADVCAFLGKAVQQGFELGQTPVGPFLRQHQEQIFPDMVPAEAQAVAEDIKLLHRLYQITPSDESLQALSKPELGITSAEDVAAFSSEEFTERFGEHFPSLDEARLVHQKAQQVSTLIYNFTTMGKQMVSAPRTRAMSPPAKQIEEAKNSLIKRFPTLETLFGSLDFCECKHCRSVLSPAAYLVDLLHFLDPKKNVWKSFIAQWRKKHGTKVPYPFKDQAAYTKFSNAWKKNPRNRLPDNSIEPEPIDKIPYDILVLRRPDLPHIPLTCENTHTLLPYIDVVNEILEYFVANGKIDAKAARDTGKVKSAELLAEPQHVLTEAYDALKTARYPLELPFDLWLETARRFCGHFDTPLWKVLDLLRPTDKLFDAKTSYDREAVFVEALGLSPAEHKLFTDSNPLDWHGFYGYSKSEKAKAKAITELESAKTLARRLGVTYKELADLVQTSFVNPTLDELALVGKLKLDVAEVVRYFKNGGKAGYAAEKTAFEERLTAYESTHKLNAGTIMPELKKLWDGGEIEKALLLEDTTGLCDFGKTYLRFGDGDPADALVLLKINLFVRLWKKLGWSMEETDRALQAFVPKGMIPLDGTDLGAALKAALLYLAHLKALDEKVEAGKGSRMKLLALWSNLPTRSKGSLYAQLFLARSVLKDAPVFDDPLGNYLSDTSRLLKDHLRTLQGVLNLTTDEIRRILLDAGKDIAPLFTLSWSAFQDDMKPGNVPADLRKEFKANGITLSNGASVKTTVKSTKWRITDGQTQYSLEKVGETLCVYNPSTAVKLSLDNVSLLYRHGLLAKGLNLSVRDLIRLKGLSGLDPFKPLSSDAPKVLADDHPFTQTLRFVELAEKVEASGISVAEVEYLLRHRFDPVGPYLTSAEVPLTLIQQLAAGLRRIYAEHAVPADPASLGDNALKQKLALIMASDAVSKLFGMLAGTVEYKVEAKNVLVANKLDPSDFSDEPTIEVSYDEKAKTQRLTYTGVLTDKKKTILKGKYKSQVLEALLDQVQKQTKAKPFFDKHLSAFLVLADFDQLFEETLSDADKRAKLAKAFLPFLQHRLSRQLIVHALATSLKTDATLIDALVTDPGQSVGYLGKQPGKLERLLSDPSQPARPLLEAFAAARQQGLTATWYAQTGTVIESATLTDADTGAKNSLGKAKPADASRAVLAGWLEVPSTGTYRFSLSLQTGTEAELRFTHLPDPLLRAKTGASAVAAIELKAGVPYRFALDARKIGKSDVTVSVQSADLPKDRLSQLTLYPQAAVARLQRAWILLAKTLRLLEVLGLSERELRHFVTYSADFDNLDLSKLPTRTADDSKTGATTLFAQFVRLADYAALKRDLSAGSDDLIRILENAQRRYPATADAAAEKAAMVNDLCKRVAGITRRNAETVRATVEHLGFGAEATTGSDTLAVTAPDFVHEKGLRKLWKLLQVMESFGASADTLAGWTGIVGKQTTETRYAAIAGELKGTIKSRYRPEDWQRIAKSIFDELRKRQRDALVAHVMHEEGFARMEELFEFFLLDPGMEPVVQTSRIQLAISSVQLFVQRCLLNLEPLVDPSVINAKHWKWMKRFRVWEANRKIFLYPENWLEPEFRDDRTHLFQELESALLQGDVSNDLAEDAFFNYLKKLEELAKLEIVTMYCEERPLDPGSNTLHVIGRTYNQPHKYFYRRYAQQMWTPWEPVTAEIEGDHIVAAFWRDRLHLFWVSFLDSAEKAPAGDKNKASKDDVVDMNFEEIEQVTSAASQKSVDVQLNWTEYFQGEWTTREAGGTNKPLRIKLGNMDKDFDKSKVFIFVTESEQEDAITINLSGPGFHHWILGQDGFATASVAPIKDDATAFRVVTKNSPPEIWPVEPLPAFGYSAGSASLRREATKYRWGQGALKVSIKEKAVFVDGKQTPAKSTTKSILMKGIGQPRQDQFSLLTCCNALPSFPHGIGMLVSPFFYQNRWHTFFVEPTLTETTIVEWKEYVMSPVLPTEKLFQDEWREQVPIAAKVPIFQEPLPGAVEPLARFEIRTPRDWVTDSATAIEFKGQPVGKDGGLSLNLESADATGIDLVSGVGLNLIDGRGLQSVELNGELTDD